MMIIMFKFAVAVLFILLPLHITEAQDYKLPTEPATVLGCSGSAPALPELSDPKSYQFASSCIQIVPSFTIPCDGFITTWKFVARNSTIYQGPHLAVFRRSNLDAVTLKLVGETYLQRINLNMENSNSLGTYIVIGTGFPAWVELRLNKGVPVRKGDFIGLYYDAIETVETLLTIPYYHGPKFIAPPAVAGLSSVPPPRETTDTLIFMKDKDNLEEYGNSLNMNEAAKDPRDTALIAIVSSLEAIPTTTTTTTTTTTITPSIRITTASKRTTARVNTRRTTTKRTTTITTISPFDY